MIRRYRQYNSQIKKGRTMIRKTPHRKLKIEQHVIIPWYKKFFVVKYFGFSIYTGQCWRILKYFISLYAPTSIWTCSDKTVNLTPIVDLILWSFHRNVFMFSPRTIWKIETWNKKKQKSKFYTVKLQMFVCTGFVSCITRYSPICFIVILTSYMWWHHYAITHFR